ncbi:MAG: holo-ACP synthase, partial [Aurantimicrobium sp.]
MILGVGVDIVDIARFTRALERTPKLGERLFTDAERELPANSLAGRFAA